MSVHACVCVCVCVLWEGGEVNCACAVDIFFVRMQAQVWELGGFAPSSEDSPVISTGAIRHCILQGQHWAGNTQKTDLYFPPAVQAAPGLLT